MCSVSYIANEYSIYYFCVMIKDLSIFFSGVIIVQGIKTVTFKLYIIRIQADLLCCSLLNENGVGFNSV